MSESAFGDGRTKRESVYMQFKNLGESKPTYAEACLWGSGDGFDLSFSAPGRDVRVVSLTRDEWNAWVSLVARLDLVPPEETK